ncbi:hypothetical protein [Amphibacillus sediminis]|uniref:hypothetical protein n=1 Tax=Amphibacillus sediminis TaxID=360185 RepID=UPI0008338769|nr:hypothetical protein [Amphibacillus sediminis]
MMIGHKRSVAHMIDQNNQLRTQLTKENKKYYEDLLIYIRTAGLFYRDEEIEPLLLEILQDILLAQSDGQSAQDYYGQDPKARADELIQTLGKMDFYQGMKLFGLIFAISSFFSIFNGLIAPNTSLNLLVLLFNAGLSAIYVKLIFVMLHRSIYRKSFGRILMWLILSAIMASFVFVSILTPPVWVIVLSDRIVISIIVLLMLVATTVILSLKSGNRNIWLPTLFIVWMFGLIGILFHLPATATWMTSSQGSIVMVLAIAFIYLFFTFLSLRSLKRENNQQ